MLQLQQTWKEIVVDQPASVLKREREIYRWMDGWMDRYTYIYIYVCAWLTLPIGEPW